MGNKCCEGNQRSDSSEFREILRSLKEIDFELADLVLLTFEGLKLLSRWEKPLDDYGLGLLQQAGLLTKQIRRMVKTGEEVIETVFSRAPACIELYKRRFVHTPIDKSTQTRRLEGFLFG